MLTVFQVYGTSKVQGVISGGTSLDALAVKECCLKFVFPFLAFSFSSTMRYEIMSEKSLVHPLEGRRSLHLLVSLSAGQGGQWPLPTLI